jgi:hypothetical protein
VARNIRIQTKTGIAEFVEQNFAIEQNYRWE